VTIIDDNVEKILATYNTITVVGASGSELKPAHYVPAHMQQHGWRIIPVNPLAQVVLGETAYPTLAEVPEQIGLVNVFRPSRATPETSDASAGREHRCRSRGDGASTSPGASI
jgi:predicted CoA-binding protein